MSGGPAEVRVAIRDRLWPAAASRAVRDLLTGPPRRAQVFATLQHAMLLSVPGGDRVRMLAVVTSDAALVANAVRLGVPASTRPFRATTADPVMVGDGRVRLPTMTISIARWWDSAVPTIRPDPEALRRVVRLAVGTCGLDADRVQALGAVDPGTDSHGWTAVGRTLVGRGPGLTPAGDDVLAGFLVGLHAAGLGPLARELGARLDRELTSRTTAFSADLVRLAAAGHAAGEMIRLLRALHGRVRPADLDASASGMLAIGHTSGADLATGVCLGIAVSAGANR
jgi:hypothetical protein